MEAILKVIVGSQAHGLATPASDFDYRGVFVVPTKEILCVLDDRNKVVKMWRELGLTCLQMAEGDF